MVEQKRKLTREERQELGRGNMTVNSFKRKMWHILENSKEENEALYLASKIGFYICHANAHVEFLMCHLEEESNYYNTLKNIGKCKHRSLQEVINVNKKGKMEGVTLYLNKCDSKNKRKWKIIVKIDNGDLHTYNTLNYYDVKDLIDNVDKLETTDIEEDVAFLGEVKLDKRQYFEFSLKKVLNVIDDTRIDFLNKTSIVK